MSDKLVEDYTDPSKHWIFGWCGTVCQSPWIVQDESYTTYSTAIELYVTQTSTKPFSYLTYLGVWDRSAMGHRPDRPSKISQME